MGCVKLTVIVETVESLSQVKVALAILTADGPVTVKSLPSVAILLHFNGLLNTRFTEAGLQESFKLMLSIGVANMGYTSTGIVAPTGILL